ncbi:TetR/AcrR family transcriptional regulator [Dictyobacter aurantiacus]|uniref:TetR family transcriptional regulator n=1 Tax=Dictyobacter aurantiacus TaxID=1936993 RepID=A0A401ZMR8_9CHLR|nr:TetR/AcrR family transcriptional regulator [Dictyobacter aurantiacus]GCE08110.1 TetR family transcriptional regulator [Dictyobacter aurantiacus]
MTQKTENLRVRRTKILLREALIALIEKKGFDALTVGDLTEQAMVSRAAFYRNYQDKYDLVEQIFEEAMGALFGEISALGREHPADVWVTFFEHIAQYDRLYRALLGSKGSPWFVRKMRADLVHLIKERGHHPHGPHESAHPIPPFADEFVPDIVSTMFVEAITWWLEQGQPSTPKEMATRTALLASAVFREASTWVSPRPPDQSA